MKKLIILGAANPNIIRTIDRINSKKNQEIIVECFVDNDNKKIGKTFMSKDVLDTQTFLKKYNKDDCLLFNSIASSLNYCSMSETLNDRDLQDNLEGV